MEFKDFFKEAKETIIIAGTNPLIPHLEKSGQFFADLLTLNMDLQIRILYESDSENFNQSLCLDTDFSGNRISYSSLMVHRDRISGARKGGSLLVEGIAAIGKLDDKEEIVDRISLGQINLRLPINIILCDERLWCCFTTHNLPDLSSYFEVDKDNPLYERLKRYIDFYTGSEKGGIYLSKPGEELIQMYDNKGYPRGIYPRACFYTTKYQRYSVWGFIFNRKGKLLLHQRSKNTKDGRLLWDKSFGGHVDLLDSSTYMTAQRELVEELFLPEAEFSKYIQADMGNIINFGEWNPKKRFESTLKGAFMGLDSSDWVFFRPTDKTDEPLTITRISNRRMHDKFDEVSFKRTVFRSDVYLFIAPPDYIDTKEQMEKLLSFAEESGAAESHCLVSIGELGKWIEDMEKNGKHLEIFTDDLLHINLECRDLLESFSEFIKYAFKE